MKIKGLDKINGKKTYIGIILVTLVLLAESLGWISPEVRDALLIAVGGLTSVAIVHKVDKKIPDKQSSP